MALYLYNGQLLIRNGAIAGAEACCCLECTADADCLKWCEQLGVMEDPEAPCPEGWEGTSAACRKVTQVAGCEECTEANLPAPSGMTDYAINCIGYCCFGVCQPTPCCPPCPECSHPSYQYETVPSSDPAGCGDSSGYYSSSRSQNFSAVLPAGVSWKPGYPAALGTCNYTVLIDSLSVACCHTNCTVGGIPGQTLYYTRYRSRYRLLVLQCPTETEPASYLDVTALALQGDLEIEWQQDVDCVGEPTACTSWLSYYGTPVPVCNEFP